MSEEKDHQEYSYAKHFNLGYDKPRYRITIVPEVLFWEITYIWVLKHWGKERVKAPIEGGYQHKFQDHGDLLYYRYPNDKSVHKVKNWKLKGEDLRLNLAPFVRDEKPSKLMHYKSMILKGLGLMK